MNPKNVPYFSIHHFSNIGRPASEKFMTASGTATSGLRFRLRGKRSQGKSLHSLSPSKLHMILQGKGWAEHPIWKDVFTCQSREVTITAAFSLKSVILMNIFLERLMQLSLTRYKIASFSVSDHILHNWSHHSMLCPDSYESVLYQHPLSQSKFPKEGLLSPCVPRLKPGSGMHFLDKGLNPTLLVQCLGPSENPGHWEQRSGSTNKGQD